MKSIETQNLDKLYYSIGEVAEMFDVSTVPPEVLGK